MRAIQRTALPLDKKERLALEFFVGVGYSHYQQKCIYPKSSGSTSLSHEVKDRVGVTKAGVNLAYRFSLRPVREN